MAFIARSPEAFVLPAHLLNWTLEYQVFSPHNPGQRGREPSRTQRAGACRAMRSFVSKFPDYAPTGGKG